jgi:hypothetical protein
MSKYSGRSQASNLSGLLSNISGTIGEMGEPGKQYVDTFRRSMAPEADMGDSASLLNYAQWARRNGYDDEAEKYLVMGRNQQKIEEEKAYNTGMARDTEKLRGYDTSTEMLRRTIEGYEESDVTDSDVGPMPNPQLENAKMALAKIEGERQLLIEGMNNRGDGSLYGKGNEGSVAERQLITERVAAETAALEKRQLVAKTKLDEAELQDKIAEGSQIESTFLPYVDYEAYKRRLSQAQYHGDRVRINKEYRALNKANEEAKKGNNTVIANQQIQVLYKDLKTEGAGWINDDDLTDFLQDDMSPEARKEMNDVITAYALQDPRWIRGDLEEREKVIKEIFVREYSKFYKNGFADSFIQREGAKALEESDATANWEPGMNPDAVMPDGTPNKFEVWYQESLVEDPGFTKEDALEEWHDRYNLNKKKKSPHQSVPLQVPSSLVAAKDAYVNRFEGTEVGDNYQRYLENMERRRQGARR